MSLIGLFVEGQTERIFFEYALPIIQLPDDLFVSRNLLRILENNIHSNKIWLVDCRGDGSVVSYIKKNVDVFMGNNFDYLILVRDYHPHNRPPHRSSKQGLCENMKRGLPDSIVQKYGRSIFINLSVETVAAWFFLDPSLFIRINPILSTEFVNARFDDILMTNPETLTNPEGKMLEIIRTAEPMFRYGKHEDEIHYIVSRINMDTCLTTASETYAPSLHRILLFLFNIL